MSNTARYITEDGSAYVIVTDSTSMVSEMEKIHKPSAVVTAAMGRILTATSLMGDMLKGKDETITVRFSGNGPTGEVICVSDSNGNARISVFNNIVEIPLNECGKLDVKNALGSDGSLTVIKDLKLKEPYIGQVPIVSGEVAEDITNYLVTSEQIPSACALGVLVDKDLTVKNAGGFILQLLPFCPEESIDILENNISSMKSMTSLLEEGKTIEDIAKLVLNGFEIDKLDETNSRYKCNCSNEKIENILASLGSKEIDDMIADGKPVEIKCHFCNTDYVFDIDKLTEIRENLNN